ncbi:MAG: hypothetical protein ABI083_13445 [Lapillicoccus sp.]
MRRGPRAPSPSPASAGRPSGGRGGARPLELCGHPRSSAYVGSAYLGSAYLGSANVGSAYVGSVDGRPG